MKKKTFLWTIALILTIFIAIFQRLTGPTYSLLGKKELNGTIVEYNFSRSHSGNTNHKVIVETNNPSLDGFLIFKRYKTDDDWTVLPMSNDSGIFSSYLPGQPPAGKLEYYVLLKNENSSIELPENKTVVIRFKGEVPIGILIPHIIFMFLSMLLSNRTGLEFFSDGKNLSKFTIWTLSTLFVGGFILGPLVQQFAFGELWTGVPFGYDLTDNKTLVAFIGWVFAYIMYKNSKVPKRWALFASVLLLIVYLIPHSVLGSELDYNKLDKEKSQIEQTIE